MFDFSIVTTWIDSLLRQTLGLGNFLLILIECVLVGVAILTAYALIAIVLIFMERKVCAYFQCRLGPMRVGPWGIFQVFADVLKMLIKEIFVVDKADKFLYYLAPVLVIVASVGTFSFLPWNNGAQVLDFNVGIFLLMGLCIISAVLLTGTMQISGIVGAQDSAWLIFQSPFTWIAFLVFLIAGNAEANRGPFDLAEAESELTAGYHTEYSGMGFGFYYLAEYLNLFVISGIAATVFLGGWMPLHVVGLDGFNAAMNYIPGIIWFMGKTFAIVWILMWIRWTFPRLRVDQILTLEWKYIMPFMLVVLALTTVWIALV